MSTVLSENLRMVSESKVYKECSSIQNIALGCSHVKDEVRLNVSAHPHHLASATLCDQAGGTMVLNAEWSQ